MNQNKVLNLTALIMNTPETSLMFIANIISDGNKRYKKMGKREKQAHNRLKKVFKESLLEAIED